MRSQRHAAFLFADMDNLKLINDTFGHQEGDKAIQAFCSIIKETFRKSDIMGRYGGDEFVIFMPETGRVAAPEVFRRLQENVRIYNLRPGIRSHISFSAGLSFFYPQAPTDIET